MRRSGKLWETEGVTQPKAPAVAANLPPPHHDPPPFPSAAKKKSNGGYDDTFRQCQTRYDP